MRIAMPSVSRRERRVLLAGSTLIAAVLFFGRVVPSWQRWSDEIQRSAVQSISARANAEMNVLRLASTRDSARARTARFRTAAPTLLRGTTSAASGAALTAFLRDAAMLAVVQLGSVDVRADTTSKSLEPFLHVTARTDITGDVHGLTRFLALLEAAPLRVAVRELTVTQAEPGAPADRVEVLHATIAVEALAERVADKAARPVKR
jgi:hypothetical protein